MQSKKINETKYASSLNWYYPPIVNDGIEFTENSEALFYTGKVKKANIIAGSNTKERAYFEKTAIKNAASYLKVKEFDVFLRNKDKEKLSQQKPTKTIF